jgi:hypothetical protein
MGKFTSRERTVRPVSGRAPVPQAVDQPYRATLPEASIAVNRPPAVGAAESELSKLTPSAFLGLDPARGNGFVTFDVTESVPAFLREAGGAALRPLGTGTWAFDGDPEVPHYVNMVVTMDELNGKFGEDRVIQLQAFSRAMMATIRANLPVEELARLEAAGVELVLDLAELRISDGSAENTGHNVHVDLYPREGMVLVIPITGNRTTIYHPHVEGRAPPPGDRIVATLLTAYERWTRFHGFDPTNGDRPNTRWMKAGEDLVAVPEGMQEYLQTRGGTVPDDLHPEFPGVLPTVHRAGEGARTVLVPNFHYSPIRYER